MPKPAELPDWLIARGRVLFTTDEAASVLGIPADHVRQRLAPLRRKGSVVAAGRGVWLAVPPERRAWGAPEPMAYIDALMACFGVDYMVGWLSAAAIHGASHQAPQSFQVATSRHVRDRAIGRTRLTMLQRGYVGIASAASVAMPAGRAKVASVGTTMLMLAADLAVSGGIDNAATAIVELAGESTGWELELVRAGALFPASARRRCGWLIERFWGEGGLAALDGLAAACAGPEGASRLDPHRAPSGNVDGRWMLDVNREVEPDL